MTEKPPRNVWEIPVENRTERAVLYSGVSQRSVQRIRRENAKRPTPTTPFSPEKKRPRLSVKENIDDFDFQVICRTIQDFYLNLKQSPSCRKLLRAIKEKIDFPYSAKSLNRLLRSRGFVWRKCQNRRTILMEKPSILQWRLKYLSALRKYQEEGRSIVYLDETWIDSDPKRPV